MKSFYCIFLAALTTTFVYEAADARPQFGNWFGKSLDGGTGISDMVSSWLSQHAPGKAGNEGEFRLPSNTGSEAMEPLGKAGFVNNKQLNGFGKQGFGQGAGRMLQNAGAGGMMLQNNQFRGPQQQAAMGKYKGPALNRAGKR